MLGFTALGENWPADTRSRNHHFFGAIVQWFYEELAGIRPLEPGYARIGFEPQIPASGLDWVTASYDSVRGPIATAWRRTPNGLELTVTIPANARGRVVVPAADTGLITEAGSGHALPADHAPGVTLAGSEPGRVVYNIDQDTTSFTSRPRRNGTISPGPASCSAFRACRRCAVQT